MITIDAGYDWKDRAVFDEKNIWIPALNMISTVEKIPYVELSDTHLNNIIALLNREDRLTMFPNIQEEYRSRYEHAHR